MIFVFFFNETSSSDTRRHFMKMDIQTPIEVQAWMSNYILVLNQFTCNYLSLPCVLIRSVNEAPDVHHCLTKVDSTTMDLFFKLMSSAVMLPSYLIFPDVYLITLSLTELTRTTLKLSILGCQGKFRRRRGPNTVLVHLYHVAFLELI